MSIVRSDNTIADIDEKNYREALDLSTSNVSSAGDIKIYENKTSKLWDEQFFSQQGLGKYVVVRFSYSKYENVMASLLVRYQYDQYGGRCEIKDSPNTSAHFKEWYVELMSYNSIGSPWGSDVKIKFTVRSPVKGTISTRVL